DRELRLVDDHGLAARRRREAALLRLRGRDRLWRLGWLGGRGRARRGRGRGGWRGRGRGGWLGRGGRWRGRRRGGGWGGRRRGGGWLGRRGALWARLGRRGRRRGWAAAGLQD